MAFGGVADGFVPFEGQTDSSSRVDGDKSEVELELASIVMKAVQVGTQHAQHAQAAQHAQHAQHIQHTQRAQYARHIKHTQHAQHIRVLHRACAAGSCR